ncbi:molybdenum cofactor synthesis protein [Candidatus Sumerlaeota bacterium]|nr:molybdenum cofactor synthesis protein [Candidatus Sumerlaeota bacterium]
MKVVSVNISEKKGIIKLPVPSAKITDKGIAGDAHEGFGHRQISLLSFELMEQFGKSFQRKFNPGEFGENITTFGLDPEKVSLLDIVRIGETVLEITQIGKECHGDDCAVFRAVGTCVMPKNGIFSRVKKGGSIAKGDAIIFEPRILRFRVITLSDRAFSGEYEDKSGPEIWKTLEHHFANKRWHVEMERRLFPDDADILKKELESARKEGIDIVITTGGTGVDSRDIAPDVAAPLLEKPLPGIMDHIRIKYGEKNPNALLSRSIAGIMGTTQVYTLPGSVRAVGEYMVEILKTMEHLILMIHGIGH